MNFKFCSKCKQEKPTTEFGIHKSRKDGLRSVCKVCNTAQALLYVQRNRDRVLQYQKEYKIKNKEKLYEQIRQIKSNKKDYYDELKKSWKQNNKIKLVIYNQNRRAKKTNQSGKVSSFILSKLLCSQQDKCANCAKKLNGKHHLDHIVPLSLGGAHDDYNLQLLCPKCNLKKHNKDPIVWANENGRLL